MMYCALVRSLTHYDRVLVAADTSATAHNRLAALLDPHTHKVEQLDLLEEVLYTDFEGVALLQHL